MLKRPSPPDELLESGGVAPSPETAEWLRETFITEGGPLYNPNYGHLENAQIGVLWQATVLVKHGRQVIGYCEMVQFTGDAWAQARKQQQIEGWFGEPPDFILSFDAEWWRAAGDAEICALSEHELSHTAQATDRDGLPRFNADGKPVFETRAHDVEAFIGVAARYGAIEAGVKDLMDALSRPPLMSADLVNFACGTCGKSA